MKIEVGTLEGLAFYVNGTDLPDEIYESCDINHVIEQMESAMNGIGRFYSYWEGNEWTALYFYGGSFVEMKSKNRTVHGFLSFMSEKSNRTNCIVG